MSRIINAIILGIAQGLCEFLPISSSGHLEILQSEKLLGKTGDGSFLTVMLHIGTLIAVFVVYRKQIADILKKPFQKKTYLLVVSTIVTAIMYLTLNKVFSSFEGNAIVLGCSFLFTSCLLLFTDFIVPKLKFKPYKEDLSKSQFDNMNYIAAVGIGAMQGIGILPGVSRSGSTIAGARLFSLTKEAAAEYSFLMSIPAIFGGFVTEIPSVVKLGFNSVDWVTVLVGMVAAAISGYFAIRFMIKLITDKKFWGFAIYTDILGILVILDAVKFHIIF